MDNNIRVLYNRILVVDSEQALLDAYKAMLEYRGFDVRTSTDFTQAEKLLHAQQFDAVVSDITFFEADAMALLKKSIEIQPNTPVIFMTSTPTIKTAANAVRSGAYDYLIKPITYENLIKVVKQAVDLKKLREDKRRTEVENLNYQKSLERLIEERTTKLKEKEKKYRSLYEFLLNVLESLSHPFIVIGASDHRVKLANSAAVDLGFREGDHCCHFDESDETKIIKTNCSFVLGEIAGKRRPIVSQCETNDGRGKNKVYEIHGFPLFDETNDVTQAIMYYLDITERENAKKELQLLGTAVEQSADSIVITDPKGVIQYANPVFASGRKTFKGKTIELMPAAGKNRGKDSDFYDQLWTDLKRGIVWRGNLVSQTSDGAFCEEETIISPVKGKNDEIQNFVFIKRDVTEKKRLESIAQSINLMNNLGYIFSGIRHEIGNPINSIKVTLSVLSKHLTTYSTDRVLEFIERALAEVGRIEYLLKELKNFTLFERLDIQAVRIDEFLNKFISLVEKDFQKKRIEIITDFPDRSLWAAADTKALHHVLLNIMTNAADAVKKNSHPTISIRLNRTNGNIGIEIKDNGCGMSPQERENLFKPFYTSKPQGTGLGLVIVQKLLSKMGGGITVNSRKNIGTTIEIYVPGHQIDD